ncbi:hypothetical protein [Nocardia brasiliensis]
MTSVIGISSNDIRVFDRIASDLAIRGPLAALYGNRAYALHG